MRARENEHMDPIYEILIKRRDTSSEWVDFITEHKTYNNGMLEILHKELGVEEAECEIRLLNFGEEDLEACITSPTRKRKFIFKPAYISNIEIWLEAVSILNTNFHKIEKIIPGYGKVPTGTNIISGDEIISTLKQILNGCDMLPNCIRETENYLEIEFYSTESWRYSNNCDYIDDSFLSACDEYYKQTSDMSYYISIDTISTRNFMKHNETKQWKMIDIDDMEFRSMFLPIFPARLRNEWGHGDTYIYPDYKWSDPKFELSKQQFINLCKLHSNSGEIPLYKPTKNLIEIATQALKREYKPKSVEEWSEYLIKNAVSIHSKTGGFI